MKKRLVLTVAICVALFACTLKPRDVSAKDLGIGSRAPPLNIEHWIQDGNGSFKPVEEFDQGAVYVVEFWATWCGPCIASMPHLAELQTEYRGQNVRIISVSDESVDEVKDLLAQDNQEVGKTFAEITSAYSLTTDPDRSVHEDYMEAAKQQGIPTSFIVGKSGLIEWIGHPMELDAPLEAVVNDTWDREAFKEQLRIQQEYQENLEKISMLAGAGQFDDALKVADEQIKNATIEPMRQQWVAIRHSLRMSAGMMDKEDLAFFRSQLASIKGDPYSIYRFGYSILSQAQQGADIGPLGKDVIAALTAEIEAADPEMHPAIYNTIARLHDFEGNLSEAVKAQQAAVDSTEDPRIKRRLTPLLEELREKAGEPAEAAEEEPEK